MATNTLQTPQAISNELLMRFQNSLAFAGSIRKHYDDRFAKPVEKIGDSYSIRVPVQYGVQDGPAIEPEATEERVVQLRINKFKTVAFEFESKELTLDISELGERYLKSAAQALANQYDLDLLTMAYQGTYNSVGVPGTTPTSLKTYQQASSLLNKNACPVGGRDRFVCYNSDAEVEIINDLRGLTESSAKIRWQYEEGRMKRAVGLNWLMDQNVRSLTTGVYGGTPAVTVAGQSGTTILTEGWTQAAATRMNKGELVSFAGIYAVNPVTKDLLPDLFKASLAAPCVSAADGTATMLLEGRGLVVSGPYQNCSASPGAGALINIFDKAQASHSAIASKVSPQNLVYHENAFVTAMVPLVLPEGVHFKARSFDEKTGMTIAIIGDFDFKSRKFQYRADILYGSAVAIPEWSCRVVG